MEEHIWCGFFIYFITISQDFPLIPGQTPPFWLKHANMILETIVKAIPGMSESCYYMAYVKFLLGKCVEIQKH